MIWLAVTFLMLSLLCVVAHALALESRCEDLDDRLGRVERLAINHGCRLSRHSDDIAEHSSRLSPLEARATLRLVKQPAPTRGKAG